MKLTAWHVYFATLLTVLTYTSVIDPGNIWVKIITAVIGMTGTVAVPSIQGDTMTEQFPAPKVTGQDGATLMGVARPPAPAPEPEAAPAPQPAPEPASTVTVAAQPEPEVKNLMAYIAQHAALLREMANGLEQLLK